jgi:hypothetical protein
MRVMRLLVYEGPDEWVQRVLGDSIKGKKQFSEGRSIIAITMGTIPDDTDVLVKKLAKGEEPK